ncbi:MAG: DUF1573 domain-containing protein [Muribaculaceae bacterium]|nr:DUF1573 domain-containing protein [Muribaculaceae bacterium]
MKLAIIVLLLLGYSVIPVLAHVISDRVEHKALAGNQTTDNGKRTTENGQRPTSPHLQLDSTYLDMGCIPVDSIGEAVMGFHNTGDAPLQIFRIFSECGCTVPSYSSDEVMPGERGEITIRFNGKNRVAGSFRKALRIRSNADNHREVFIVKGRIIPDSKNK